jgi:hypothetical protein
VAVLIGADVLEEDELDLRRHGWEGETPLWLYVLGESAVRHDGDRLGEVGGLIVGEVLVGVIARDPEFRGSGLEADAPRPREPLPAA